MDLVPANIIYIYYELMFSTWIRHGTDNSHQYIMRHPIGGGVIRIENRILRRLRSIKR